MSKVSSDSQGRDKTEGRVAIISGRGMLPACIAKELDDPVVCALDGFSPDNVIADVTFRVERLATLVKDLHRRNVTRVTFAGAVQRPKINPMKVDVGTIKLVPRILQVMQQGDDGLLRSVIEYFEENGFEVVGVAQIAPSLLPSSDVYAGQIDHQVRRDRERAAKIVEAIGAVDVGQGCVVAQGMCLAVEALPGTDAMLASMVAFPATLRPSLAKGRGLFYKASKPGQDMRIDLPTLGPQSVDAVVRAGLGGIAWQAGGVICIDLPEMIRRANRAGVFLWAS